MELTNRLLPGPGEDADRKSARKGSQSESSWSPSALTTLTDWAAEQNNELAPAGQA